MKFFDRVLQNWRTKKAIGWIGEGAEVLDIGCYDAIVFERLGKKLKFGLGIDPVISPVKKENYELIQGYFPKDLNIKNQKFDAITLLAVLEHIPDTEMAQFAVSLSEHLKPGGHLIITVPDVKVDYILEVLKFLRIIDGMSLEEHHGFNVKNTKQIFEKVGLKLVKHSTFQLGLNNLFVFKK